MSESGLRSSMIALSMCNFMVAFMVSGVGACLPSIGSDLHASAGELSLISAVYVLSLVIFNIVAAQLIAIMGQRRVFLYGFAVFLVMCLSLAFSPTVELVWGQRFVQGAGAAMVATSSVTLLISIAPRSMQGRLMGLLTASTYVGIALGPLVGGGIATMMGWRWLFVVLLPLGVLAWFAMFRTVKGQPVPVPTRLDLPGIGVMGAGFVLLTIGASCVGRYDFASWFLAGGGVVLVLFVFVELHVARPVVDVRFIAAHPSLILGLFAALVNFGSINGLLYYFMLYLQQLRFLTPLEAGAFVALQSVTQSLLSPLAGKLSDRIGPDPVSAIGLAFSGTGILLSTRLDMQSSLYFVGLTQCIIGVGLAFFAGPNTLSIVRSVDTSHTPEASGLANTMRTLGMLISLIVVSATMTSYLGTHGAGPDMAEPFLEGMRLDLRLFVALNVLGLLLVSLRIVNTWRCGLGKGVDCMPDPSFFENEEEGAGAASESVREHPDSCGKGGK